MLVLNLPFKALMFLTLMRPSLVLFLVLWLKLVKDFLKVRCRLALLPFLISCLIWLDLVASLPLIKERILVIILLLHFLRVTVADVLAAQPVTTNLLKFMRASIKMIGVSNLQSFIASMTQKLTLSDISDESKNYLDKAGITTACLRIKSKWTAGGK